MLKPRLTIQQVVSEYRLISAEEVFPSDPRLIHLDQSACVQMSVEDAANTFVQWPDGSVGFVCLKSFPSAEFGLAAAYVPARFTLEYLATMCAGVGESSSLQ